MGSHEAIPDAMLELVLLGVDSPLCLLRAAATCKRWGRIIGSDAFRALDSKPPIVAGYYYNNPASARPRFELSPSVAIDAGRFSLDFLPSDDERTNWMIKDSRGSLLLLVRDICWSKTIRQDLIVCEPLTRRYVVIPPRQSHVADYRSATAVLFNGDDDAMISMSSFRVLCLTETTGRIRVHSFTSGSFYWRGTSTYWQPALFFGVAAGRRYCHDGRKKVLVLDQSSLSLSTFVLSDTEHWDPMFSFTKVTLALGHDGEARVVVVDGAGNNMKIFARVRGGGSGNASGREEWALEKAIKLSAEMLGVPWVGRLDLTWHQPVVAGTVQIWVQVPVLEGTTWRRFRLDMDTMEAEVLLEPEVVSDDWTKAYPSEFPWPPSLCGCCADDNA